MMQTFNENKYFPKALLTCTAALLPEGLNCISGSQDIRLIAIYCKNVLQKSKTAINHGSLPPQHKSARLFLLRKSSSCASFSTFFGLSLGCHIIRLTSGSRERAVKTDALQWCAETCIGGVLFICFSHYLPACLDVTWSCLGLLQSTTVLTPPVVILWSSLIVSHHWLHPSCSLTLCFFPLSSAAHYPWRLCRPFWCWAGWQHSDQYGKSDNWKWRLHGAIRGPEDDGR